MHFSWGQTKNNHIKRQRYENATPFSGIWKGAIQIFLKLHELSIFFMQSVFVLYFEQRVRLLL